MFSTVSSFHLERWVKYRYRVYYLESIRLVHVRESGVTSQLKLEIWGEQFLRMEFWLKAIPKMQTLPLFRKHFGIRMGKQMMHEAKGALINHYGGIGWELVATKFGEDFENTYIFKRIL